MRQVLLRQARQELGTGTSTYQEDKEHERLTIENEKQRYELTSEGHPFACYSYAREIYINLKKGAFGYKTKKEQKDLFTLCLGQLDYAALQGVSPAFFYLGMIYLEGNFVQMNPEKAMDYYTRGAAKNNAYCFFELNRIYREGVIVEKDPYLEAKYLLRSAEEGYVLAQHNLGIAYHEGVIFKKNDFRALAWFREAIRNGGAMSYYNAGKLLLEGDES